MKHKDGMVSGKTAHLQNLPQKRRCIMHILNVGVDLGVTSKHQAEIRDEKGNKVRPSFSFSCSQEGFDALSKHALKDAP